MRICCLRYFYYFARTATHNANNAGKNTEGARYPGKCSREKVPTYGKRCKFIQTCFTRYFSTLTHETCLGSSRPDPHETPTSPVARSVAGRVESDQQGFKSRRSDRVGSGGLQMSRVGSIGLRYLWFLRVGSGTPDP